MNRLFIGSFVLILTIVILSAAVVKAEEELPEVEEQIENGLLFEDNFHTWDYINKDATDAEVNTDKGEIQLPGISGSQSFDVTEDAMMVMNGNFIEFYTRNSNGFFSKQSQYTDEQAIAVAMSDIGYAHYVLRDDGSVTKMEYGAGDFIRNPVIALTGLRSATTISASKENLIIGDLDDIFIYSEGDTSLSLDSTINFNRPISQVSYGPNSEIVVSTDNGIHVLRISEVGYIESPFERLLGATYGEMNEFDWRSGLINEQVFVELEPQGLMINLNHEGVVGTKLQGGSLFVRDATSITEYVFDGSNFFKVGEITGLTEILKRYLAPRYYQSIEITLPEELKRFGIVAEMETPESTTIEFEISPNGVDFYPANGSVVELPEETETITIRANLANNDHPNETPILKSIKIYDRSLTIELFEVTRIVRDPGGNPELPTTEPVMVWGGYNFDLRVTTYGARSVFIHFSNGEVAILTEGEEGIFIGTHHFPAEESADTIDATVIALDENENQVFMEYLDHFIIVDNIMNNYRIYHVR